MSEHGPTIRVEGEGLELVLTRRLAAPRARVWEACTDPARVARWWGAHGVTVTEIELEARPGGVFRIVMRAPDGNEYPNEGRFQEVEPPERLAFSIAFDEEAYGTDAMPSLLTATFEEADGGTELTLRNRFGSPEDRAAVEAMGWRQGWTECLERLAAVLEEG